MRIPDSILKCVTFIGRQEGDEIKYRGTGFFVLFEHKEDGTTWRFAYLVTAKHTADMIKESTFYVRVNLRTGRAEDVEMNRHGQPTVWYTNPRDPDADVAVTTVGIPEYVDQLAVGHEMIIDENRREQLYLGVGDEVFMIGLFSHLKGKTKNVPICRTGNIAMYPEEKIAAKDAQGRRRDIDAFLVEARSIGGLSGSPVFARYTINVGGFRERGTDKPIEITAYSNTFYLVGLVSAHWDIDPNDLNSPIPSSEAA
jgi:hypothetical protein